MTINKFYYKTMRLKTGEIIKIKHCEDERSICPICGFVTLHPCGASWDVTLQSGEDGIPYAFPSWDICPGCDTQYGEDDAPATKPDGTKTKISEEWWMLRVEWFLRMRRDGKLSEALQQLGNIDLSYDDIKKRLGER